MKIKIKIKSDILKRGVGYHTEHTLQLFKYATNCDFELIENNNLDDIGVIIEVDNQKGTFSSIDSINLHPDQLKYAKENFCFKFHYTHKKKKELNDINLFPFTPISFYNWYEYFKLEKQIKYTCNSDIVLNNQRIYGNAVKRRTKVRKILSSNFNVDFKFTNKQVFWNKINNCLVYVHVPGYRTDILDRSHLQYMAFGCCVISTNITTVLPNYKDLIPGIHYIKCKEDFSDLVEKVNWCKNNRNKCVEIGQNAKKLFQENCTPNAVVKHVKKCLS